MKQFLHITLVMICCFQFPLQLSTKFNKPLDAKIIPVEKTIHYKLAESIVPIKIQQYGDKDDIAFINLHDDESTSVEATKRILEKEGGLLIEVENNQQRFIRFRLAGRYYKIDPNSIFSKEGVTKSLHRFGKVSPVAIKEVEKMGKRILGLIPGDVRCIISLHNNTPDYFSAMEYLPGNTKANEAKRVYINPEEDADDFYLTTETEFYEYLTDKGFNTILQENRRCTDDGSLSVYCGKNKIRYINCETEHGKHEQYYKMIQTLIASPDLLAAK